MKYFAINIIVKESLQLYCNLIRGRINWKADKGEKGIDRLRRLTSKKSMRASGAEASQYEITGQLGLVPDARLHGP